MNPVSSLNENAQKWVRALRSGLFNQTDGFLNKNGSFCCLGVACELAMLDGVKISKSKAPEGDHYLYDGVSGLLPEKVQNWLGLKTTEGMFAATEDTENGSFTSLTELNDTAGYSFTEIADFVERNPDGLFKTNYPDYGLDNPRR